MHRMTALDIGRSLAIELEVRFNIVGPAPFCVWGTRLRFVP